MPPPPNCQSKQGTFNYFHCGWNQKKSLIYLKFIGLHLAYIWLLPTKCSGHFRKENAAASLLLGILLCPTKGERTHPRSAMLSGISLVHLMLSQDHALKKEIFTTCIVKSYLLLFIVVKIYHETKHHRNKQRFVSGQCDWWQFSVSSFRLVCIFKIIFNKPSIAIVIR